MNYNTLSFLKVWMLILFSPFTCFGYDDIVTHPHLTKDAIQGTRLNNFLQQYLGLQGSTAVDGSETILNGNSILKLLQEGSTKEDEPDCRAANHFHNPITLGTWDEGKLNDPHWLANSFCDTYYPEYQTTSIASNLTWGTGYISPDQNNLSVTNQNEWDWESAREYYFTAITGLLDEYYDFVVANEEGEKKQFLEKTLQAVGQVSHLLQDISVPAHVRNDFSQGHTMGLWASYKDLFKGNAFENYLRKNNDNKPFWDLAAIRAEQTSWRLTDFWDTNQFNENFNGTIDIKTFGLAEYTNLNFLSEFTMFTPEFPFPKVENVIQVHDFPDYTDPNPDGNFERIYIATNNSHPGEQINHLAVVSILNYSRRVYFPQDNENVPLALDPKCYDEYASHLIPRAIGFSADLIDYFFRGRIEISPIVPQNLVVRGNGSGGVSIFKVKTSLKNVTNELKNSKGEYLFSNENMLEGSLYVVATYEVDGEVQYSLSKRIYLRSEDNNLIDDTTPSEYEFDFSKEPIPWNASNLAIQVVFRGTLGNEQDIAVAVGRQLLFERKMEITPPSEYVYSILDAKQFYSGSTAQPQEFNTIKASLYNELVNKELQDGTLTAIASYRRLKNYIPDLAATSPTSAIDREDTLSFSISLPILIDQSGSDQAGNTVNSINPEEFEFNFSNDPIPAGITDLYLYIVFQGNIHGSLTNTDEPDSLVVGIKDLNEPQHLTYWNNTDYFLLDGFPRTAEDIRQNDQNYQNDPGFNGYGYIDPHNITESVSFSGNSSSIPPQELVSFALEHGRHSRIIILTDAADTYYDLTDTVFPPGDTYNIPLTGKLYRYSFKRMINQLNSDGLWYNSPVYTTRSIKVHDSTYFVNDWPVLYLQSNFPESNEDMIPQPTADIHFPHN